MNEEHDLLSKAKASRFYDERVLDTNSLCRFVGSGFEAHFLPSFDDASRVFVVVILDESDTIRMCGVTIPRAEIPIVIDQLSAVRKGSGSLLKPTNAARLTT